MDWMIFGGIGLISEMGRHSQDAHINQLNSTRSGIAKALCCDSAFEREMWNLACDPSKQNLVWDKIEVFKRTYPHLCVGRSDWEFVGKNRLLTDNPGRKTLKTDGIIADNCSKVVSLLCRTHGKLSSIKASEVAMTNSFYLCWSALPNDKIYPVWNQSASQVRSLKETFASLKAQNTEKISQLISEASGERHDAIVYMVGMEFDPSYEEAVSYITNRIKKMVNIPTVLSGTIPNGVIKATTTVQYNTHLSNGGAANQYIENSIRLREQKEQEAQNRPYPFGVTYIPDGGDLPKIMSDILWADAILKAPDPTIKDSVNTAKGDFFGYFFDGSMTGILAFIFFIVAIIGAIWSIVSFQ